MSRSICNPEVLQQLLSEQLTELQEERLAEHLENCPQCRERLEVLASGDESWKKIENALRNETTGQHLAGGQRSTLIPVNQSVVDRPHSIGVDIDTADFAIDFLTPSENSDALGQLNNIEIRAIIGHGGNGIVLKGFQEELQRLVAVKVMAPQLATSAAARKRFAREAQATAAIVHPSVMPILTVHSEGQLPYLVMPYVDCESLQDRIDREGALPLLDILRIGHQVAKGLAAAHSQGLVHRDVKPANILLERGVDRVMLTDFGLARAVDDGTLTRTGLIAGTPQYMSPEQAGGEAVDTRSDLFSLGSVVYAMCTGRPPFRAETTYGILKRVIDEEPRAIATLNPELPGWLVGYVQQLMSKMPTSRTESAEQIAGTFEQSIAHVQQPQANDLPDAVRGFAKKSRTPRRWRRWPFVAMVLIGGVLLSKTANDSASVKSKRVSENPLPASAEQVDEIPDPMTGAPAANEFIGNEWSSPINEDLQLIDLEAEKLLRSLNDSTF